ncbi:hypothetical protein [Novosphingobium sp.]|uniref:hypothetical protein n=1 Tax=Novosphingobium sp. TaxID=1874826 RepID=UPI003B529865
MGSAAPVIGKGGAGIPARLVDGVVAAVVVAGLAWGWSTREQASLDPHGWPGYLIGIAGTVMMVAAAGLSWRKRRAQGRISVGAWYNAHVLLGLFGPVLVLVHARFAWGSINSSFALGAMGLVITSGLFARYGLGPARRRGLRWAELWHYGHAPLCMVLVLAVIVHIYMAHAY